MSKYINVNPAHYKVAGRERQGEDIAQHLQKQAFGERRAEVERWQARSDTGAPGWEDPAQPMAEPEPAKPVRRKRAARPKSRRKPTRARKPASTRRMAKKPAKRARARAAGSPRSRRRA
jgi:hypothetical protein